MKKVTTVLIAFLLLALTVIAGTKYSINKYNKKAEEASKEQAVSADNTETADLTEIVTDEPAEAVEATTAEIAEAVTTEDEGNESTGFVAEVQAAEPTEEEANIDEITAYSEDISEEEVEEVKNFIESQPDIDEDMVETFFENYPELDVYQKDKSGVRLIPLSYESLMSMDKDRPGASVKMGLNKNPINDAVALPFNLSEEQVKKVLNNDNFTEDEVKALRTEWFKELLENPWLLRGTMELYAGQKFGENLVLGDHWEAAKRFNDLVSKSDKGMNVFLRKVDGKYYVNLEAQKLAVAIVNLLYPMPSKVENLTAKAKNHYHLVATDQNSTRKLTPADYEESLASLTFRFYLKNGKVGLVLGANLRDKRPEVLNNTTVKKSAAKKATPSKVTKPDPTPAKNKPDPNPSPNKPDPSPSTNKPDPNPSPKKPDPGVDENKPDPKPKTEKKDPTKDPVVQGNAQTGGDKNDDTGPGPQKPDQGNSKSDKVEESQYQQGNSENTDGNNVTNYDQGPAADYTDGGAVPQTVPIDNTKSQSNDDYVKPAAGGGQSDTPAQAGKNNGKMKTVPSVD